MTELTTMEKRDYLINMKRDLSSKREVLEKELKKLEAALRKFNDISSIVDFARKMADEVENKSTELYNDFIQQISDLEGKKTSTLSKLVHVAKREDETMTECMFRSINERITVVKTEIEGYMNREKTLQEYIDEYDNELEVAVDKLPDTVSNESKTGTYLEKNDDFEW